MNKIRKTVPELLNCFDYASATVQDLKESGLDEDALKTLCAGWQWHKMHVKSERAANRNHCRENEAFCLEIAAGHLQEKHEIVKERVYHDLNHIVRSSAMAECVSSVIRPCLNTSRNQISQEMPNLIMFYHNHRRYNGGERAGKTPYEILSGKKQGKDWPELLFEIINDSNALGGNTQRSLFPGLCVYDKIHPGIVCYGASDDYVFSVTLPG